MQKAFLLITYLFIFQHSSSAQKEDYSWFLGGNFGSPDSVYRACRMDFSTDTFSITYVNKDLPYRFTNTSICDSNGNFLCYSNGENLYERNLNVVEGGLDFYPSANFQGGVNYIQGYLLLPLPGAQNKIIHIYGVPKVVYPPSGATLGYIKLQYAIADMALNGGLGKVTQRNILVGSDTLIPAQINAVRHGNGRDWWLLAPYYLGHRFYRYLLTPEGLHKEGVQGIPATDLGLGHTCFSPNGQWYARFNWHGIIPDSSFATIELYRFDRCSGLLSDRIFKTYDLGGLNGRPGGVAFSPSSRFMYVTRWDSLFQYDLQAPDIIASEQVVAVYDGFAGDLGLPTRFFYPLLAPDNKIYICVSNYNSRYLHRIEQPDLPGLACNVQQHSIYLPVFNNFLLPNVPFYRLWEWEDSPCDTIGSVGVKELAEGVGGVTIYPNPAQTEAIITFSQPVLAESTIRVINGLGQVLAVHSIPVGSTNIVLPVANYPNGYYFIQISDGINPTVLKKVGIIHY